GYSVLYPMIALGNITVGFQVLLSEDQIASVRAGLPILLYLGVVGVFMMLIPIRKVDMRQTYKKWILYWRLRKLEQMIYRYGEEAYQRKRIRLPLRFTHIDMLIYQTMTHTLDYRIFLASRLKDEVIYKQITRTILAEPEYYRFIEALSQVNPEQEY